MFQPKHGYRSRKRFKQNSTAQYRTTPDANRTPRSSGAVKLKFITHFQLMKLLLDENLPKRLKQDFSEHEIYTVRDLGWNALKTAN